MRYLSARTPGLERFLLVESGSRPILEAAIPRLRNVFGAHVLFDLVTCYPGMPANLDISAQVWRTQDFRTAESRTRLLGELRNAGATVVAILCSNQPIMSRWKWWLAWNLPAKLLIINENADCFWLDTANLRTLLRFVLLRMGLAGEPAGQTIARCFAFPFVLAYLVLYATIIHARRAIRLTFNYESDPSQTTGRPGRTSDR